MLIDERLAAAVSLEAKPIALSGFGAAATRVTMLPFDIASVPWKLPTGTLIASEMRISAAEFALRLKIPAASVHGAAWLWAPKPYTKYAAGPLITVWLDAFGTMNSKTSTGPR